MVLDGRSAPAAANTALSPMATSTPKPTPTSEAKNPTRIPSASTERVTCFRLAPSARSRASSRSRWATMIVNVL